MHYLSSWERQTGFTLVEVMVAVVLLTTALLALAASAAVATRQLVTDAHELGAASTAQQQIERASARSCTPATGTESVAGVLVTWQTNTATIGMTGTTTTSYPTRHGRRTERYEFAGGCR